MFVKTYECLKQELEPADEIVFLDFTHPQYNARAGYGWILKKKTKELPTNAGRQRLNITGALTVSKRKMVTRQDNKIVNTYSIAHVLFDQAKNIYVILDNASYNHAKPLIRIFEKTSIKFVFLPHYSPNLNLIERLWRFYHKKITEFKRYKTFQEFKETSLSFFDRLKEHEPELRTLLRDNFNIISKPTSKIITN